MSLVDTEVIAMGLRIAKEKNEHHLIRKRPQPLTEFRPTNFEADYKRKFDETADSDSEEDNSDGCGEKSVSKKAAADLDDEWNNVGDDRQTRRTKKRTEEKQAHFRKKHGNKIASKKEAKLIEFDAPTAAVTGDEDSDSIDDENEGGEWITEENLYKHLSHGVSLPIVPTES